VKILTPPGLELRLLSRPASSQSLYRLLYPSSQVERCRGHVYLFQTICLAFRVKNIESTQTSSFTVLQFTARENWTFPQETRVKYAATLVMKNTFQLYLYINFIYIFPYYIYIYGGLQMCIRNEVNHCSFHAIYFIFKGSKTAGIILCGQTAVPSMLQSRYQIQNLRFDGVQYPTRYSLTLLVIHNIKKHGLVVP
jgi:hypothetical protein